MVQPPPGRTAEDTISAADTLLLHTNRDCARYPEYCMELATAWSLRKQVPSEAITYPSLTEQMHSPCDITTPSASDLHFKHVPSLEQPSHSDPHCEFPTHIPESDSRDPSLHSHENTPPLLFVPITSSSVCDLHAVHCVESFATMHVSIQRGWHEDDSMTTQELDTLLMRRKPEGQLMQFWLLPGTVQFSQLESHGRHLPPVGVLGA